MLEVNLLLGARVLVVDDDDDARLLARLLLERHGATVDVAPSVSAAHELLERVRPDAIVSDLSMPDEDGLKFATELRSKCPAVAACPLIAHSGMSEAAVRASALRSGFDAFVPKSTAAALPYTVARLLSPRALRAG